VSLKAVSCSRFQTGGYFPIPPQTKKAQLVSFRTSSVFAASHKILQTGGQWWLVVLQQGMGRCGEVRAAAWETGAALDELIHESQETSLV